MLRNIIAGACVLTLFGCASNPPPPPAPPPTPAPPVSSGMIIGSAPGMAGAMHTVKATATITAIDPATRVVTLKDANGHVENLTAGPEVKNFAQMKVGDLVTAEYVESLTLELKKGGRAIVGRSETAGQVAARPGDMPAGAMGRQVTIVADVIALDPVTQTVTLKGATRTVDLKVHDPAQFALIKVGDQIEANYTEAVAISVEPVKR
jgi:Cu/Ag efflux protein CusF